MDPSLSLLTYYNSFDKKPKIDMMIHRFINNHTTQFNKFLTHDQQNEQTLLKSSCIPLSNMFVYHNALVLANIDAVYNLLNMIDVHLIKSNNQPFTYMVVGDEEANGFVEYIQYRRPLSFGVGYFKNLNYQIINAQQFKPYDGYYINKTLKENWKHLISDANGDVQEKYNLVIGNDHHFVIQCIIGLSCSNQHFVVLCDNVTKELNMQIIYLLSQCFTSISIMKPMSMTDNGCYVICEYIKSDINEYIKLLEQGVDDHVSSLYNNLLPKNFIDWLEVQIHDINHFKYKDQYDLTKIPLIWNLPDNINYKIKNDYIY